MQGDAGIIRVLNAVLAKQAAEVDVMHRRIRMTCSDRVHSNAELAVLIGHCALSED